jgi:2,3,4,5-tetrahydropyridine-2-carboxylate N-succinyltransferase
MQQFQSLIDDAWERRAALSDSEIATTLRPAIEHVLDALEAGASRMPPAAGSCISG